MPSQSQCHDYYPEDGSARKFFCGRGVDEMTINFSRIPRAPLFHKGRSLMSTSLQDRELGLRAPYGHQGQRLGHCHGALGPSEIEAEVCCPVPPVEE